MSVAEPPLAHRTVLREPAVDWLLTAPDGVYVDATFGRGGHSAEILRRLGPRGRLFAFDCDPEAAAAAAALADARLTFVSRRFAQMEATLRAHGIAQVHGVLLDLGVSSPQLDDARRGFSLRLDGPLDMRMDPRQGESAAQWLARASVDELARVIRDYGEERFAVPIAEAIVARRRAGQPLVRTAELAALVADAIPRKSRKDPTQHPATRTFQAIRIHVNQELEELALILAQAGRLLAPGGRLVAISFHSLEDRLVKQFIARHAHPQRAFDRRAPLRAAQLPAPRFAERAKLKPDAEETARNPRARSAVLRVAERTAAPWGED